MSLLGEEGGSRILLFVKNLGPIRDVQLEIPSDGIAIVVGPNASGKTFLAEAFLLALEAYAIAALRAIIEGERRVSFEIPRVDVYFGAGFEAENARIRLVGGNEKLHVDIRGRRGLVKAELGENVLNAVEKSKMDVLKQVEERLREALKVDEHEIGKIASVVFELFLKQHLVSASVELLDPKLYTMSAYLLAAYVPTERIALAPLLWGSIREALAQAVSRIFSSEEMVYPKPLLLRYMVTLVDLLSNREVVEKANELLMRITHSKIRFEPEKLSVKFEEKGRTYEPQHMATGTLQLAGLTPFLAARYRYVIIEEPELNLHADGHIRVTDVLWEARGKTLLVTTHSDIVAMRAAKLYWRDRSRGLKLYLLRGGTARELRVFENGEIEEIETISRAIDEVLQA